METIYLIFVIVLVLLAASDLIVGVSNDAVNFLNSAIGSKVAPLKVILLIASVGVLVGATFSSGMMEVARKGIFHPQYFYFNEIMVIFLAVMVTDILLLDAYNTFGMPTSTTVSIVFELLGAAVGMSIIKTYTNPNALSVSEYINSGTALTIISGILLSVAVAFIVGAVVQYITRFIFTFRYKKNLKYFGAIWGGIAITAITYFILIKGAKGASFMSDDVKEWIKVNTLQILGISFVAWFVILQLLSFIKGFSILKLIVLVGTFALAMAFAGNDLVNFIGVPLAGLESFKLWLSSDGVPVTQFLMEGMAEKVKTPTLYLLIAGIIMIITIWTSKKARTVTETEINLARQELGYERFEATGFARAIVRISRNASDVFRKITPGPMRNAISKRFEQESETVFVKDHAHFDLIRASVNLTLASILISFATSLKLPLSTTYVTFMVAMGTSLSDRAWGRESAVYRITGVFSVIGGWFLTALIAFTVSLCVAFILFYGHIYALVVLLALIVIIVVRTRFIHKKNAEITQVKSEGIKDFLKDDISVNAMTVVSKTLSKISENFNLILRGLESEDVKELRKSQGSINKMTAKTKYLINNISLVVDKIKEDTDDTAYYFVQVMDYLRESLHSISFVNSPALDHVRNNHKPLLEEQINELDQLNGKVSNMIEIIIRDMDTGNFSDQEKLLELQQQCIEVISSFRKKQIKRVKNGVVGTRNTMLYLNLLNEIKNLVLQIVNVYKSQRDFMNYNGSKG